MSLAANLKASLSKLFKRPHAALLLAIYFLYCAFLCFMEIKHHVFWRDEVRALSIAKQASSLPNLVVLLKNEGHPILWYIILKSFYLVFHANWVLPLASLLIAMASAFLWLWFAPFSIFERALFLTGVLSVFEFSILARNYGISMLLMFIVCTQFKERFAHPYRVYLPLFLLPFTNAHSALIAALAASALVLELLLRKPKSPKFIVDFVFPALVYGAVGYVLWILHADSKSAIAYNPGGLNPGAIVHAITSFFLAPGHAIVPNWDFLNPAYQWYFSTFVVVASALILIRRPILFLTYVAAAGGLSCFSDLIYPMQLRHQGVLFIFWLSCVWVDRVLRQSEPTPEKESPRQTYSRYATTAVIVLLFAWQGAMGWTTLSKQMEGTDNSAVLQLATLFQNHPEWKNAVLIGEPDYFMDTIPYYLDNLMFFPRDGHYRNWGLFTREWRTRMSFEELLDTAARLYNDTPKNMKKPIIFLIGTQVRWSPGSDGMAYFGCYRTLSWTAASSVRFSHETHLIGNFPTTTAGDETYNVYEWLGPSGSEIPVKPADSH